MRYRSSSVFSLGGWSPRFPPGLACPGVLRIPAQLLPFTYGTLTLFRRPSQTVRFRRQPCCRSSNPAPHRERFGLLRVRSPLLAESSLFLGLLRCFSSPTYLPRRDDGLATTGFPHSDTTGCLRLHTPDRCVSSCTTSFFGTGRLGIHRAPFSPYAFRHGEVDADVFPLRCLVCFSALCGC